MNLLWEMRMSLGRDLIRNHTNCHLTKEAREKSVITYRFFSLLKLVMNNVISKEVNSLICSKPIVFPKIVSKRFPR